MNGKMQSDMAIKPAFDESRFATHVTLVGMLLDIALGGLKILIGTLFHSYALIADGFHSFSDAASDIMVIILMRFGREDADEDHPYGHQRFETFGTVLMGFLLIGVAGALAWDSFSRVVFEPEQLIAPGWPVLLAALASIIGKEWIFHYTRRAGERIRSDLIIANAWHSRSDAFSSVIVLVAAAGAMAGYPWLDAVAAIGVALVVAKIGWDLAWESLKELVDTALDADSIQTMRELAMQTEGVHNVHCLRSRRMGGDILLDIHLQVSPAISVSEGHQIGLRVIQRIREAFPHLRDVTYHVDAEDDEENPSERRILPNRSEVLEALQAHWAAMIDFDQVGPIRLHYLGNQISVELFLQTHDAVRKPLRADQSLVKILRDAASDLDWMNQLQIWYASSDCNYSAR